MADFDPDAYLKGGGTAIAEPPNAPTAAAGFDPDAYLKAPQTPVKGDSSPNLPQWTQRQQPVDWNSLYGGLEGLDDRLTPSQKTAMGQLDANSQNPAEARAKAINQLFVSRSMPQTDPAYIRGNWDTVKKTAAKELLGITPSKNYSDTAFYGGIAEMIAAKKEPNVFSEVINMSPLSRIDQPEKIVKGYQDMGIGPGDPVYAMVGSIPVPIGTPAFLAKAWNAGPRQLTEGATTPLGLAGLATGMGAEAATGEAAKALAFGIKGFFTVATAHAAVNAAPQTVKILQDPKATLTDKATAMGQEVVNAAGAMLGAFGISFDMLDEGEVKAIAAETKGKTAQEAATVIAEHAEKMESPERKEALINTALAVRALGASSEPTTIVRSDSLFDDSRTFDPSARPGGAGSPGSGKQIAFEAPSSTPDPSAQTSTTPIGGDTYGIAARVSEQRAKAGQIEEPEPGEGLAAAGSVERGRELLQGGADPEKIISDFEETKRFNSDDFATVRAHGENLAKAADAAADKFGKDSAEYKAAAKADSDWIARIKPMQTEWSNAGRAQQGETDIDTGSFHALQSAFKEATGRDFTPEQAQKAQQIADGVKGATVDAEKAKADLLEELRKRGFVVFKPKGSPPEPGSVADIWARAKAYLEAGEDDFDNLRHKIAADTGLPVSEVTKKLAGPKTMRVVTNDMYSKMARRRMLVDQANYWLKVAAEPGWLRFTKAIPRAFFQAKVFGHGTVGMITHAGINIFDPTEWGTYWPEFVKQYKLIGWHDGGAFHERAMQDLTRDPNYITARRAGLANNAFKLQDDYQKAFMGKLGLTGNRGFDALKIYRQARFNQIWDVLTDDQKTPEMAKLVADDVNHSTGYVRAKIPNALSTPFFAPRLEVARWAWLIGDTAKDAKIFATWKDASPEEQSFAIRDVKRKAIIAGTYASLLAANEGLLLATGSKEKINWNNPRKPDYLAFKGFGHQLGVASPTIGIFRYLANMLYASIEGRTKAETKDSRREEELELTGKYVLNKLSPFGSFVADVAGQADYSNRPLPFSKDKVPAYLRREGKGKYTAAEYAASQLAPIPLEDAIKEVWSNQGMSQHRINDWLAALATGAIVGGTGARVEKDTQLEDKPKVAPNRNPSKTNRRNLSD